VWTIFLTALLVNAVAHVYLMEFGLKVRSVDVVLSILIDPGWRIALIEFPEGVHAGMPFVLVSCALNTILYGVGMLGVYLVVRYFLADRAVDSRNR